MPFGFAMYSETLRGANGFAMSQPSSGRPGRSSVVKALAASEDFVHAACATSFEFLYGRIMNSCEDATYERCVAAFKADGRLRSAMGAIAREPEFCR